MGARARWAGVAARARYPNLPGGIEVSPGYDAMIPGADGQWTPPDFAKYGPVQYYTDNITAHNRPNGGWCAPSRTRRSPSRKKLASACARAGGFATVQMRRKNGVSA